MLINLTLNGSKRRVNTISPMHSSLLQKWGLLPKAVTSAEPPPWLTSLLQPRSVVHVVLLWIASPIILGTLSIVLAFLAMINASQRTRYKRKHKEMRMEFDKYRKEMQAKVQPTDNCVWPQL